MSAACSLSVATSWDGAAWIWRRLLPNRFRDLSDWRRRLSVYQTPNGHWRIPQDDCSVIAQIEVGQNGPELTDSGYSKWPDPFRENRACGASQESRTMSS